VLWKLLYKLLGLQLGIDDGGIEVNCYLVSDLRYWKSRPVLKAGLEREVTFWIS
jgi:hypothetical protein